MTMYNPHALSWHVDRGRKLIEAIYAVEELGPKSLDEAIALLIACIDGGYDTIEEIHYVWDNQRGTYDIGVCDWLLAKFTGFDPSTDLWSRDATERYKLLNPALAHSVN